MSPLEPLEPPLTWPELPEPPEALEPLEPLEPPPLEPLFPVWSAAGGVELPQDAISGSAAPPAVIVRAITVRMREASSLKPFRLQ
jgi:hypothetical protein